MDLIDEYLRSVRSLLPKQERDDIIAELSANVAAQVEERRAQLGRPLVESDEREILARLGSPLDVAGRYATGQGRLSFGREWIGPVLFPFYVRILTLNMTLALVACVAIGIALHGYRGLPATLGAIGFQLLLQFAIVTGIFVAAGRHLSRLPERPSGAGSEGPSGAATQASPERVSRLESFAELVALAGLFGFAYASRASFGALFSPGDGLYLSPAWRVAGFGLLALAGAWTIQAAVNLARPDWTGFRSFVRIATSCGWLALLAFLLASAPLVLVGATADPSLAAHAADLVNRSITYTLIVVVIVSAGVLLRDLVTAMRRRSAHVAAVRGR
jgi:hypothetical protein